MVRDIVEAVSLPCLDERSLRLPLTVAQLPEREQIEVLGPGILAGDEPDVQALAPPPRLGEHTAEILDWLDHS